MSKVATKIKGGNLNLLEKLALGILGLAPVMFYIFLRRKVDSGVFKRKFERYSIDSTMKLKVGDRELVGSVGIISVGGAKINADVLLDKGSVISMTISSPDGSESVEVQGMVVWSDAEQKHGVQFMEVADGVAQTIKAWTGSLNKA